MKILKFIRRIFGVVAYFFIVGMLTISLIIVALFHVDQEEI